MLLGKMDSVLVERARSTVTDAVAPLLDAASRPADAINNMIDSLVEMADLRGENALLRRENDRLRSWQALAQELEAENAALRKLTHAVPNSNLRFVSARVIGDPGGAFARSVLVNTGAKDGVAKGQAAITSDGLAGRVAEAGMQSARVLLITDINSRIPVLIGQGRDRAILAGDNSAQPKLLYLAPGVEVAPGDRVVTSGRGGAFPPGLPVGVVSQAGEGVLRIQPFVDWAHLEYLRLAEYELNGILSSPGAMTGAVSAEASPAKARVGAAGEPQRAER